VSIHLGSLHAALAELSTISDRSAADSRALYVVWVRYTPNNFDDRRDFAPGRPGPSSPNGSVCDAHQQIQET
jgi:hypothetical protein